MPPHGRIIILSTFFYHITPGSAFLKIYFVYYTIKYLWVYDHNIRMFFNNPFNLSLFSYIPHYLTIITITI